MHCDYGALRDELARLGTLGVRLPDWDPFILGETDRLEWIDLPAMQAARHELLRWRSGRFPSLVIAVADAVFSKQRDYEVAVRTMTRPFALAFREMPLVEFVKLDEADVHQRVFVKAPRPGNPNHLSPEGRIRTIGRAASLLAARGISTPEEARVALSEDKLSSALLSVFGFGEAMLANVRMNVGLLGMKLDVHVRAFLAPYLGIAVNAPAQEFENRLTAGWDAIGMEPFEVDQIVWYTRAASGRSGCSSNERVGRK